MTIKNKVAAILRQHPEGIKFDKLREVLAMPVAHESVLRSALYTLKNEDRASFDGKRWKAC